MESKRVTSQGKVRQVRHLIRGASRLTEIEVAHYDFGGGTDDALTVPARPGTDPTHTPIDAGIAVPNYIGGDAQSPPWSEPESGSYFSGNYSVISGFEIYPHQLRIQGPDIEQEARDIRAGTTHTDVDVAIPTDEFQVVM